MNKLCAFFIALLTTAALAQDGTIVRRSDMGWSASTRTKDVTTAALNLFVATTGNDSASCTSVSTPCLTLQGAINKVPKTILHPVTILLGTGNFAGATVANFSIGWTGSSTTTGLLTIQGTLSTFTPATGTATGTATGASASSGATFGTLTDSGQSWTVNDLTGKILEITGGTGSSVSAFYVISSNTDTVITVTGSFLSTPAAGSTYAIRDWGTTINTATPIPTGLNAETETAAGLYFANNSSGDFNYTNGPITVYKLKVAPSSGAGIRANGPGSVVVLQSRIEAGTGVSPLHYQQGARLGLHNSYVKGNTVATVQVGSLSRPSAGFTANRSRIEGGSIGWQGNGQGNLVACEFLSSTTGILSTGGPFSMSIQTSRMSGHSGRAINSGTLGSVGHPYFSMFLSSVDISTCGVAVQLEHGGAALYLTAVSGSSNTTAIQLSKGARLQATSSVTLTGTTELSIDGVTSDDLADMRAASPKLLTNTYGTIIYE